VLISGEPGIGKTTLAAATADEARTRGIRLTMARAPETTGAPPYWLMRNGFAWRRTSLRFS
jgi:thymidylate kinase